MKNTNGELWGERTEGTRKGEVKKRYERKMMREGRRERGGK